MFAQSFRRPNNPNFTPKLLVVKFLTQTYLGTEVCTFYVGHPVYGIIVCVPFADIYEGAPVICCYTKQLKLAAYPFPWTLPLPLTIKFERSLLNDIVCGHFAEKG